MKAVNARQVKNTTALRPKARQVKKSKATPMEEKKRKIKRIQRWNVKFNERTEEWKKTRDISPKKNNKWERSTRERKGRPKIDTEETLHVTLN